MKSKTLSDMLQWIPLYASNKLLIPVIYTVLLWVIAFSSAGLPDMNLGVHLTHHTHLEAARILP